jgi:hypothetical protein
MFANARLMGGWFDQHCHHVPGGVVPTTLPLRQCLVPLCLQPKKQKVDAPQAAPSGQNNESSAESSTCFVGNMAWSSTEDSMRKHFKAAGKVISVRIGEGKRGGMCVCGVVCCCLRREGGWGLGLGRR